MNLDVKGLTLDNYFFKPAGLIRYCTDKIERGKHPAWKLGVYRFILDFLDDSGIIIQKTSGTTGKPKTIELPKNAMLASAKNTVHFFNLKEGDVAALCLPIEYIAGKMMVVRALVAGMKLELTGPSAEPDFTTIRKVDFCAMVPMQASNLLKTNSFPKIKTLILGGAETNPELTGQLQQTGSLVYETYGMAETCSHVALKKLTGKHTEKVFAALPGIQLSTDNRNCLVIEAPYLSERIITNDCIEMVVPNQFKWLGRFDNVINSGGLKIQPENLEKQFQELLKKPCAIIGKPDKLLGQKMVLVVETAVTEEKQKLHAKLTAYFERKMLPKEIYLIQELPKNKSYKIDREALKKLF